MLLLLLFVFAVSALNWTQISTPDLEAAKTIDWSGVKESIANLIYSYNLGPSFIRLAYHDAGSFSVVDGSGGGYGLLWYDAVRETDSVHRGLLGAMNALETVVGRFGVSRGDAWSLAGAMAVNSHMNGDLRVQWAAGRQKVVLDQSEQLEIAQLIGGRLPYPTDSLLTIQSKFARMGMSHNEWVALLGAHSLGRCTFSNSGYSGYWTADPSLLSNDFHTQLLSTNYFPVANIQNSTIHFQFNATNNRMMLPSDMLLKTNTIVRPTTNLFLNRTYFETMFVGAFMKLISIKNGFPVDISYPRKPFAYVVDETPPSEADILQSEAILSNTTLRRMYFN